MKVLIKPLWRSFVDTAEDFYRNRTWRMAAAITFYLLFTLGPMLALELQVAGLIFSEDSYKDTLVEVFSKAVGEEGGEAVENLLSEFELPKSGGFEIIMGVVMMLFGGTNAMGQTRTSISSLWDVEEKDHDRSGWKQVLIDMGFTLGAALILVATAIIHSLWFFAQDAMDADSAAASGGFTIVYLGVSFILLSSVFYAIFRILPPIKLAKSALWAAGGLTAILFVLGRELLIQWIAASKITSTYGSVSFMILLLVWMYFFSQLILFGADFAHRYDENLKERTA